MRAGIREIRDGFSKYIAKVREGEQIIISDRGRDIAVLRPLRQNDPDAWLKDLVEEGLAEEPGDWTPIETEPRKLRGEMLSDLVAKERNQGW